MKATVLIDNIASKNLVPEWGLSIYIEYGGYTVLLDTGGSGRFLENAASMGIDICKVQAGVLSHAHYDHSDGMEAFFKVNQGASFYLREGSGENCYGKKWIFSRYIGIRKGTLETYENRIVYVTGDYELAPGVYLIPHKTPGLEETGRKNHMYIKKGRQWFPDNFSHEQSLVFDTSNGLVIYNSCSHGGADNIIREVEQTFPGKKLYALIGGFHLYQAREEEVRALAGRILATGIEKVYTGHCTGQKAFGYLKEELGGRVSQLHTGLMIEL